MSSALLTTFHSFFLPSNQLNGAFAFHTHCARFQQEMEDTVISPEKAEEAKLKARYPNLGAKSGGSGILKKRLQKGVRFTPKPGI